MVRVRRSRIPRRRLGRVARARMMRRLRRKQRPTARTPLGHQFTRIAYLENYIQATAGGIGNKTFGAMTFSLDQLPNYTEFTELYDLYKINKVKVTFIPKINSATLNASAQMPILHTCVDSNDASTPSFIELMQNEDMKTTRGTTLHTRYFTPKCQTKLYESIASDGYAVARRNPFINTADPTVPHYALKWAIENPISGGDAYWYCDVKVKFYFSCREVQ